MIYMDKMSEIKVCYVMLCYVNVTFQILTILNILNSTFSLSCYDSKSDDNLLRNIFFQICINNF